MNSWEIFTCIHLNRITTHINKQKKTELYFLWKDFFTSIIVIITWNRWNKWQRSLMSTKNKKTKNVVKFFFLLVFVSVYFIFLFRWRWAMTKFIIKIQTTTIHLNLLYLQNWLLTLKFIMKNYSHIKSYCDHLLC